MKKLLIFILCLGMIFTVAACGLSDSSSSNGGTESSGNIDNSSDLLDNSSNNSPDDSSDDSSNDSTNDSSNDSSSDFSNDNSGESSDDSSTVSPPIIDGENEMPLVPIG